MAQLHLLIEVDWIGRKIGLLVLLRVPAVNLEELDVLHVHVCACV